jgi:hypothetical protein
MFKKFVYTIPACLNWLAATSLVVLLVKILYLNAILEWFSWFYEIGVVVEGLLASVLASYVFYLVVVHFKEIQHKSSVYPYVTKWAEQIVGDCKNQLSTFAKAANTNVEFTSLTQDQINAAMAKFNPQNPTTLLISISPKKYANGYQYLDFHRQRTKRRITELLTRFPFIESELMSLLMDIDDCSHFNRIEILAGLPLGNTDLSAHSSDFFNYCLACRALHSYLTSHVLHSRG